MLRSRKTDLKSVIERNSISMSCAATKISITQPKKPNFGQFPFACGKSQFPFVQPTKASFRSCTSISIPVRGQKSTRLKFQFAAKDITLRSSIFIRRGPQKQKSILCGSIFVRYATKTGTILCHQVVLF
jgi:hypothetical protein